MHISSTFVLFLSAIRVATAQNVAACSQFAGYQPAVTYCAARFPAPIPTVTRTTTMTVTVKATTTSTKPATSLTSTKPSTTYTTIKSTTTPATNNGRTRTITAVAEETVTNCAGFTRPTCAPSTAKIEAPGGFTSPFNNAGGLIRPVSPAPNRPTWGRINGREAEPEADPQFGGSFFSGFQAIAWARLLQSGNSNVQNACSCLRPAPSRTVTVSTTATVIATVK